MKPTTPAATARRPDRLSDRLDALLDAHAFSGVALIAWRGEVVLRRACGHAPDVDARWRWCSVTKQVTAALAVRLALRGELALDAPLPRVLVDGLLPGGIAPTPRELLTHTSGLPLPDDEGLETAREPSGEALTRALLGPAPRIDPPGAFRYNNLDYLVLGVALERLAGRPFAEVLRAEVLEPLGMTRSGLTGPDGPGDLARGHLRTDAGRVPEPAIRVANYGAAGALYGPADDLWRFDEALLGGAWMPEEGRRTLWTPLPGSFGALGCWAYDLTLASGRTCFVVHRGGLIGGVEAVNLLVPRAGAAVILLGDERGPDHYQPHLRRGLAYDLLGALHDG